MKHFAYSCSVALGGWLALGLLIAFGLHNGYGIPLSLTSGAAMGAGLLAWAACGLLFSVVVTVRERCAVRRAMGGEMPGDGAGTVVIGSLQASGDPLRAPFNGEECLAYDYEVVHNNKRHGNRPSVTTAFKGRALAPCTIASGAGNFRLLTVPELDPKTTASRGITLEAAERYVGMTRFQLQHQSTDELQKRWDDDNGIYRSDISYMAPDDVTWSRTKIEQHAVRPHAMVCVVGYFSTTRHGFVPAPVWGKATLIYQCSAEQLLATLKRSAFWRLVWAVVLGAAAAGLVWAFISHHFR